MQSFSEGGGGKVTMKDNILDSGRAMILCQKYFTLLVLPYLVIIYSLRRPILSFISIKSTMKHISFDDTHSSTLVPISNFGFYSLKHTGPEPRRMCKKSVAQVSQWGLFM